MKTKILLISFVICLLPLNNSCSVAKAALKPTTANAFKMSYRKVAKYTGKCGKYVFGFAQKRYSDPNDAIGDINTLSSQIGKHLLAEKYVPKSRYTSPNKNDYSF